ncbi:type III PLP-dependent enzyme domain-containing protein [Arthrobacter sp. B2a2-09]|uniref:diaminopimelate decarboxylase n=1 Tax=Arthrobacter sp. B2a2-09 TaxID=2952822 RepID=UPI0022CDABDA|nr:diaminopimelate decarboxylase [Arthrobacter sp. B2a2-09]MCZ9883179.1 diaminopimelate decarboxylase [Arthrobacter sp. B2a2-09]
MNREKGNLPASATADRREAILKAAISQGLLHPEEALAAAFIDMDGVAENVAALHREFSAIPQVLHAFAAKANCLVPALAALKDLDMGCEVASEGELAQAIAAGFPPARIVFDSPAKTVRELRQALSLGVAINADNFQELDRIAELLERSPSTSTIGVRINPQVGVGGIEAMSTAGATSKFGVALNDEGSRSRLLNAYRQYPWLTSVHAHVGSQGCPLSLITEGISRAVEFADEVNAVVGRDRISTIDIGGGLPVDFETDDLISPFGSYVQALRHEVPALFNGRYSVITEFGRTIMAKFGFIAAHVEYTKEAGGQRIAITHAGAQVAMRTVFLPEVWPVRVVAHDGSGRIKGGDLVPQDVAGPCCFAGDLVAKNRLLPVLEQGDIVALLDTGSYYFSTPLSYNSLPEPGVYGATVEVDGTVRFSTLRLPQTIPDLLERSGASQLPVPAVLP